MGRRSRASSLPPGYVLCFFCVVRNSAGGPRLLRDAVLTPRAVFSGWCHFFFVFGCA